MHAATCSITPIFSGGLPEGIEITGAPVNRHLANRLICYAQEKLAAKGFESFVKGLAIEIYTVDNSANLGDQVYCVRWTNGKSGFIEVSGIHIDRGMPCSDYGLAIG